MGLLVPNLLQVADIPQIAGLIAPRPLVIDSGITPQGKAVTNERLRGAFDWTRGVYRLLRSEPNLRLGLGGGKIPRMPMDDSEAR